MRRLARRPMRAVRACQWQSFMDALDWSLAAAVIASTCWTSVLLAIWLITGYTFLSAPPEGVTFISSVRMASLGAGLGLLLWFVLMLFDHRKRGRSAVLWCPALASLGAAGWVLTHVAAVGLDAWLPPTATSSLVWAGVGGVAGLIGYRLRLKRPANDVVVRSLGAWFRWPIVGAGVSSLGWAAGLLALWLLDDFILTAPAAEELLLPTAVMAAMGTGVGLLAWLTWLAWHRFTLGFSEVRFGIIVVCLTAAGGALTPLAVVEWIAWMSPNVSSSLVWAAVGSVVGLVSYALRPRPIHTDPFLLDEDEVEVEVQAGESGTTKPKRTARPRPGSRLVPILVVAGACLIVALVAPPSHIVWVVVAVGLLGFAAAWAIHGQERRIHSLERQVRTLRRKR